MSNFLKYPIQPPSTTVLVCSDVPEAILVTAHAASNCMSMFESYCRRFRRLGTSPALITLSIGGFFSRDNNRLLSGQWMNQRLNLQEPRDQGQTSGFLKFSLLGG